VSAGDGISRRHGIRYDKTGNYTIGPLVMFFVRAIENQNGVLTTMYMSQTCSIFRALIRSENIYRTNKMHFDIL
jgi:hypothetical protein